MATATPNQTGTQAESFRIQAKIRLLQRGLSITQLASELGLARNTVSLAINQPGLLSGVKERVRRHLHLNER